MSTIVNEPVPHRGTITAKTDTDVTIQIHGRLGVMTLPIRLILSDKPLELGQSVFFMLSLIEVQN